MAYLLTEIALEMLGCRFYDIYGLPHEIRYITNDENATNGQNTALKNEVYLETLLDINGSNTTANSTASGSTANTLGASSSSGANKNANIIANQPAVASRMGNPQIEKEVECIKQQLLQQRCLAMTDCKLKANASEKDLHIVTEALIRNEHKKLSMEAHNLSVLRQVLEAAIKTKP